MSIYIILNNINAHKKIDNKMFFYCIKCERINQTHYMYCDSCLEVSEREIGSIGYVKGFEDGINSFFIQMNQGNNNHMTLGMDSVDSFWHNLKYIEGYRQGYNYIFIVNRRKQLCLQELEDEYVIRITMKKIKDNYIKHPLFDTNILDIITTIVRVDSYL